MANIYGLTNTVFPNDIQTFKEWEDLTPTDSYYYLQYINALANKQTAQAKMALQNIADYQNKLPTAIDFNTICDTLIACEKLYSEGGAGEAVTDFLNKFTYKGTWSASTTYSQFNMVTHTIGASSYLYMCAVPSNKGTAPQATTTTTWIKISVANPANTNSVWKGVYVAGTSYVTGDMVSYNNVWYLAITDNPSAPPSADWTVVIDFNMYNPVISETQPTGQGVGNLWFQII